MKKRAMTLALMLALTAGVASALEVAGTTVPDKAEVAGQSLQLNGAGVRKKVVFDVYVASLYTGAKVGDAAAVIGATTPRRMELRMLREVSAGTMHESFVDGLQDNVSAGEMKRFAPQLDALDKVFREVKTVAKGDVIQLDLLPGQGTKVTVRGKAYPLIAGDDFASALLSIWLGKTPVQAGLKAQLLGAR
ncbi:chalcone isomerase family protein [Jeongeupia chitinilytica]|uniref:Chalcone isomerase n=1 Tax=Jeongeupia chitinilytica TaxID=1041641 RepID=A0ABQ3GZZ7_9NEIS|nr:chalcone isomerase family protein [Jeongeupia chitinilytica]GHD63585.1 chalcone isomerase [Jeongeupia chitinilytica]